MPTIRSLVAIIILSFSIFIPIFATPPSLHYPYKSELTLDRAPNLGETAQVTIVGTKIEDPKVFPNQTLPLWLNLPSGFELVTTEGWTEIPLDPSSDYRRFEKRFFPDTQSIMVNATIKAVKNGQWTIYGDVFTWRDAEHVMVSQCGSYIIDNNQYIDWHYELIQSQHKNGKIKNILPCKEGTTHIVKSSNGDDMCVKEQSKLHLINRGIIDEPEAFLQYYIRDNGKDHFVKFSKYAIVQSMYVSYYDNPAMTIRLGNYEDGKLTITIPRSLIDAKNCEGNDDVFTVLADHKKIDYNEIKSRYGRTLKIDFEEGTENIKIIGSWLPP